MLCYHDTYVLQTLILTKNVVLSKLGLYNPLNSLDEFLLK